MGYVDINALTTPFQHGNDQRQRGIQAEEVVPPWKVLVVDDSPPELMQMRFYLARLEVMGRPLQVDCAASTQEAMNLLERHGKSYALAFIDIFLETETAGFDLIEKMRNDLGMNDTRIVVRSGLKDEMWEAVQKYEIDDFIEKSQCTPLSVRVCATTTIRTYALLVQRGQMLAGMSRVVEVGDAMSKSARTGEFLKLFVEGMAETLNGKVQIIAMMTGSSQGHDGRRRQRHYIHSTEAYDKLLPNALDQDKESLLAQMDHDLIRQCFELEQDMDDGVRVVKCLAIGQEKMVICWRIEAGQHILPEDRYLVEALLRVATANALRMVVTQERMTQALKHWQVVAHDFNTPISQLHLTLDRLRSLREGESVAEYVTRFERPLDHLRSLLETALSNSASQLSIQDEEPANADEHVRFSMSEVYEVVSKKIKHEAHGVAIEWAGADIEVVANLQDLQRTMVCLVRNALTACKRRMDNRHVQKVQISAEIRDAKVVVSVTDNGVGMDADQQSRIWQPFHREVATPSYGLGLNLVNSMAQVNRWTLTVQSQPGVGSSFMIGIERAV